MSRRILAAIAATTWLAGCVSVLGVDAEEHDDVSGIICACSDAGPDLCEAFVTSALERSPDIQERVLDCAASGDGCAELDACLVDAGVCSGNNERCSGAKLVDDRVNVRCCEGFTCGQGNRCRPGTACVSVGGTCGAGDTCCNGLACAGGKCPACGSQDDPCGDGAACCATDPQLVCSDRGKCLQCQPDPLQDCNANFPCCGTGECPLDGVCPP